MKSNCASMARKIELLELSQRKLLGHSLSCSYEELEATEGQLERSLQNIRTRKEEKLLQAKAGFSHMFGEKTWEQWAKHKEVIAQQSSSKSSLLNSDVDTELQIGLPESRVVLWLTCRCSTSHISVSDSYNSSQGKAAVTSTNSLLVVGFGFCCNKFSPNSLDPHHDSGVVLLCICICPRPRMIHSSFAGSPCPSPDLIVIHRSVRPSLFPGILYRLYSFLVIRSYYHCVAGWESIVHDARVFQHAIESPTMNFPHPPEGKYYLVDSGYPTLVGYIGSYKRYPQEFKKGGHDKREQRQGLRVTQVSSNVSPIPSISLMLKQYDHLVQYLNKEDNPLNLARDNKPVVNMSGSIMQTNHPFPIKHASDLQMDQIQILKDAFNLFGSASFKQFYAIQGCEASG
ncbi:hypothetical protein K1719_039851 [Acacia pycnantha]|nr:hypothetical protein K1719_039851 [Acacia pycnantha]